MSEISRYVIQGHLDAITHDVIQDHLAAINSYLAKAVVRVASSAWMVKMIDLGIHDAQAGRWQGRARHPRQQRPIGSYTCPLGFVCVQAF
ncbi:MAG: hypothetical protein ACLP9L_41675 [Thermoguttaceae bacterium]